jgi:hypothetical protein
MQYRIVKLNNGKYRVQGRMPLWFWLNGIWDGNQWLDYLFETSQQALEYIDRIYTESHAEDVQQVIGVVRK